MSIHGLLSRVVTLIAVLGLAGLVPLSQAAAGASVSAGDSRGAGAKLNSANLDWPQFLHDPQHDSVSNATAFTPANAASAAKVWHWQPPTVSGRPAPVLDATPIVVAGVVYIGAQSGGFYALNESTGAMLWSRQLDTQPLNGPCIPRGITGTAAVLPDPVTGTPTVYVPGARFLYALNAATGALVWKTRIGPPDTANPDAYYNWSSPAVVNGHIYVGLASSCDNNTLIRGGAEELDQHTGQVQNTWYSVPPGSIGGSVWSSVAVSHTGNDVWVSTGNECDPTIDTCPAGNQIGHSLSIVHLSGSLKLLQAWQAPGTAGHGHDWDFGASPTLFGGAGLPDVGACNKDGVFYALAAKPLGSSPLWTLTVGVPTQPGVGTGECIAAAVWDGTAGTFYIGGDQTTIGGVTYRGSIGQVNPATGAYIWHIGLPCAVEGTPTLDSAGVLAVGTYSCPKSSRTPGAYLINASTGAILKSLPVGLTKVFGQPVFAQGTLFVATEADGLYDFAP